MRPFFIVTGGLVAVLIVVAVAVVVRLNGGQPVVPAPSNTFYLTPSPSSAPAVISVPSPA